jgi:RNA polymerase sigma factor (sigma-70 family)
MPPPDADSIAWPAPDRGKAQAEGPAPVAVPALNHWFTQEVHPHEASLRHYLRGSFPGERDLDDVVQESFLRIWRARASRPIHSARAFLFRIARNLALDSARRRQVTPIVELRDLSGLPVVEESPGAGQALEGREKLLMLADAIEALPPRCREVVILRKLQHLSQRETAARLNLAEKTVEAQLARGLARCEDYLRRRGVRGWYDHD